MDRRTFFKAVFATALVTSIIPFASEAKAKKPLIIEETPELDMTPKGRIKKAMQEAYDMIRFEPNDFLARQKAKSHVLETCNYFKNKYMIDDFAIVCDATNNTPAIIDNGQFVMDVYIKPSHSAQFTHLNMTTIQL